MQTGADTQGMNTPAIEILQIARNLGSADEASFMQAIGPVVERSPWVVERAWRRAPFENLNAVHAALCACILEASDDEQLALLRAHPELAGSEAQAGTMTDESQSEQARLGLHALDAATLARLTRLNQRYRERFGYPLLVALRLHQRLETVLQEAEQRLAHSPQQERQIALAQITEVMRGRLFGSTTPS